MMAKTKEERLKEVHDRALRNFDNDSAPIMDERMQCVQDRRFVSIAGAMWEGSLGNQFENKPKIEVNKIALALIRIFNEYRNNRIEAKFTSKEGKEYDKLADLCADLYRADNQDCDSDEAKDNAFDEATAGGFGAYRLRCVYENEEDDEDDRQRIVFEPITDADTSVYFDINAKRQDKSDAMRCTIINAMSIDAYKSEYGDDPQSWPKDIYQTEFDWTTPDIVYVAEYYEVEHKKEKFQIWESLTGEKEKYSIDEFEETTELKDELTITGWRMVSEKSIKRRCVHKYILSGGKVLEDCGIIAGKYIPIVPTYGKRFYIDNIERCVGHVRLAKDAQRLKNMQLSRLAEISALSPIEKPIVTPEQISGHQLMWQEDNIKNYPYLLINPVTDMNGNETISAPVGYTKPPSIPPAMAALLQVTEQDIGDILGNQNQGEQITANASGRAVELVQNKLDMQTYIYMSNAAKAEKLAAKIWLSMAKEVYVEDGRKMKGIKENGEKEYITLNQELFDSDGNEVSTDISDADMDISVDVGASSASKRQSTTRALREMMAVTQDPETLSVLSAMAIMNTDGEGMGQAREFFRMKLIKMGVIKPTEQEAQRLAEEAKNMPPDANTVYLQKAAEQAEAEAKKANADTVYKIAQAENTQAKTDETKANTIRLLQEIDSAKIDKLLQLLTIIDKQNVSNPQSEQQQPPTVTNGEQITGEV